MTEKKSCLQVNKRENGKMSEAMSFVTKEAEQGTPKQVVNISKANKDLMKHMKAILKDGRQEAEHLRRKHKITYWLLIILSTLMFLVGLALFTGPIWAPLWLGASWPLAGGSTLLGVLDLYALYHLRPLARIQKLMGDISQMTVALNSFQMRVALRLIEITMEDRHTIGQAADHLKHVADETVAMIEKRFEKWLDEDLGLKSSPDQDHGKQREENNQPQSQVA